MIYLIHFTVPVGHARHYLGWTEDHLLPHRLRQHRRGKGSRLTQVALERGSELLLVRLWPGADRTIEARFKAQGHGGERCPMCNPASRKTAGIIFPDAIRESVEGLGSLWQREVIPAESAEAVPPYWTQGQGRLAI